MKATETPVKLNNGYGNPIKKWYEENTIETYSRAEPYESGMFITINNHQCYYKHLSSQFRELYISILSALGIKLKRSDVKEMIGKWIGNRVTLPPERKLLELLNYKVPILLCGVHNYKPDDYRSKGNEYLHSHYFLYNIHHYLPTKSIDMMKLNSSIKNRLGRYVKSRNYKKEQGIIDIEPVMDKVTHTTLYDYLTTPNLAPEKTNLINYIANNRHLTSIQYPLTTIYSSKHLC
tara:strand:+ start:804 stop:1505 length:702 start_codon:yes stop_codon:yes gene_type:complete